MTTRIEKTTFSETVQRLRINVETLISELEKYSEKHTIKAECGDVRFSGIEDMRKNLSQLAGCPTIHIGQVKVDIGRHETEVLANGPALGDEERDVATNTVAFLNHYKVKVPDLMPWIFNLAIIFFVAGLLWWGNSDPEGSQRFFDELKAERGDAFAALMLAGPMLAVSAGYFFVHWKIRNLDPVFYNPRETFSQRNGEKIGFMVFGVLLGAFVKWLFG